MIIIDLRVKTNRFY